MPKISQETVEKVASANDIVDVIGGYFPLKRAGSAFKALCPFHQEKSPSFHVNPQRQSFHCFGCGAGGSVFRFVMLYESLDFPGAVRRLAEKAGIPIIEDQSDPDADKARSLKRRLVDLHLVAARFFHRCLIKTEEGAAALAYLTDRGFGEQVVQDWRLGYALDGWENLIRHLSQKGFSESEIRQSGLVSLREDDRPGAGYYDRFRGRIMIPISNDMGEIIAFSGRVLKSDLPGGKYVNSPETPLFIKGNILFGLDKTKRALINAKTAIVCEGQLDLIRAYEAGIQNVIAPQGTAFTPRQAAILKRYVEEVVLCFDSDVAGRKAAERSAPALFEAGLAVRVAKMPAGEDPDSLIRNSGADAFRAAIADAPDFFDFLIEVSAREHDVQSHRGRSRFAALLAEAIAPIKDPVLRDSVIGRAAAQISVAPDVLRKLAADVRIRPPTPEAETSARIAPAAALPKPALALAQLIRNALNTAADLEWMRAQVDREFLKNVPSGELLERVLGGDFRPGETASVTAYLATLPAEEEALISGALSASLPHDPAEACWNKLQEQWLKDRLKLLRNQIHQPELPPDTLLELQKEILDLKKQLTEIARPRI